ncbi:MAG: hypothetical protein V1729_02155 [Candidatus Woesearchaeota archaeon]
MTVFDVIGDSIEKKSLVEIRFAPTRDVPVLKIIESIPKSMAEFSDIILTQGGVFIEKDPVLMFTFNDLKAGETQKAVYVINKGLTGYESSTFPAEESTTGTGTRSSTATKVCGDGKCVSGESFLNCCDDCGCLPGHECYKSSCISTAESECKKDADCEDGELSTNDRCTGVPRTCEHALITICTDGDGYCPGGCIFASDDDCDEPAVESTEEESGTADEEPAEGEITGPQESPKIAEIIITPEEVDIGGEILIAAKVTDKNGKADIARVWFEVLELANTHGEKGDLNDKGNDGDKKAGDDIYSVTREIKEYYLDGYYHITIFAKDKAGNQKKLQKLFKVRGGDSVPPPEDLEDCGTDMSCFVGKSSDCSPAEVEFTATVEMFGTTQTYTDHYELRGLDAGRCVFYIKSKAFAIEYTDELKQQLLDDGYTQAQLDAEIKSTKEMAAGMVGTDGTCLYQTSALHSMLDRWNKNQMDATDFDAGDCSGSYF